MNLIIETDLGHDPDDFFAILWLLSVGANVRAIVIQPGDKDQIAIASFLRKQLDLDFTIGVAKKDREKLSSGSVHYDMLKRYGHPLEALPDGFGPDIVAEAVEPDTEFFVIGPVTSVGTYLRTHEHKIKRATMQGGFLPYSKYRPSIVLEKFEGKEWVPTFNLNGDRPNGVAFTEANIEERRFVSKNICHTVVYDKTVHARVKPKDEPSELFKEAMDFYLARHDEKKFHDPTAAVCHMNPNVASWVRGKIAKMESGWTTVDGNDYVISDINYDLLWECVTEFKYELGT